VKKISPLPTVREAVRHLITNKLEATLRSMQHIHNNVHFHLNGVSSFKLRNFPFYIGVMHTISRHDEASLPAFKYNDAPTVTKKKYHHYPPFEVVDVSSVIPLTLHP
jgi:hypothetical protein